MSTQRNKSARLASIAASNILFGIEEEEDILNVDVVNNGDYDDNDISDQEEEDFTEDEEVEEPDEIDVDDNNVAINNDQLISQDGTIWMSEPHLNPQGRVPAHNILREQSGPSRQISEKATTPANALNCFITDEILEMIVSCSNEEGIRVFGHGFNKIDKDELKVYLGLLLLAGVYRGRFEPIIHLWSLENGRKIFNNSMPRDRFLTITRIMRFDKRETRLQRRERDKLAPLREVITKFTAKCKSAYRPGPQVCVDEQLVVYRGRCPFKVYMPNKPGKYGMKIWACCDVGTGYLSNMEVYTGKIGQTPEIGQSTRVVLEMTSHLQGSGRGITADNFFTSLSLVETLLFRKLTFCGTVRRNKRFIPPIILDIFGKDVFQSTFAFREKMTIVSYIPKQRKNVILLSSQHYDSQVSERPDKKPSIILHYNASKGAVDSLDKSVRTYSCQRKSRRWPMILFQNILDIAAFNAFVIFTVSFFLLCMYDFT